MGWTIHLQPMANEREYDLLLTLGRATYVAGAFEHKCKFVLRMVHFGNALQADPVLDLQKVIANQPREGVLHRTLQQLVAMLPACPGDDDRLQRARQGRNFIAHEGSNFSVHCRTESALVDYLDRLHKAVRALAGGDNLVSAWVFEIEEPREDFPRLVAVAYEDALVRWILDPIWDMLSAPDADPSVVGDGQIHESGELYRKAYPNADFDLA
ncbi:hypothetical protein [Nocardia salmonicida]|uniref:hypothetical protein n=1 Tax=Nocardia salmonicida TaxID=53431 RepID=UPI0037BE006C